MIAHQDLHFESTDLGEIERFFVQAYPDVSVSSDADEHVAARMSRRWLGTISFDELAFGFHLSYEAKPLGRICLCRVRGGRLEVRASDDARDVFVPGDVTFYPPPESPSSGRVCDATFDLTVFDTVHLDRVATTRPGSRESVRLVSHRPVSEHGRRQLNAAIDYVSAVVHDEDVQTTPLAISTTASLLAATVLSAIPNTASADPGVAERTVKPTLLRRAISYTESHADADIALADIADYIHVTPRALQYMFRRHLDTTPMAYLRRVRMDLAHRELLGGDPATVSVHTVAAKWGFAHSGRFASTYRKTFGRTPSDTLRN